MSGLPVLALDQGTTGSTALVVSAEGHVLGRGHQEFPQHFPEPGRVEHDAEDLWRATVAAARQALEAAGAEVGAVGVANQRETVVAWDPETLKPLHRAIVWQDRRTAGLCRDLKAAGHEERVRARTGLLLDPYFSATKLRWLLDADAEIAARAESGDLAVGTVDSWLVARLTGGAVHATDPTNASRTLLFDLDAGRWNDEMLDLFGVPGRVLPAVRPSSGDFGFVRGGLFGVDAPVAAVAGDQQAALFGHGCWSAGHGKCTYGTGAFLLVHTGRERPLPGPGLLATAACGPAGDLAYAVEGSVFAAGAAVQWLRDGLEILDDAAQSEALARSLEDNGGVHLVPAFAGLGAPHWIPGARGAIVGLTRGTTRAHLARAALEAMAYGTFDLLAAMEPNAGATGAPLSVDGGAARNNWLMQFAAGVLNRPLRRPELVEATALGVAGLAGLRAGTWRSADDFAAACRDGRTFEPAMAAPEREALLAGWRAAVRGALAVAAEPKRGLAGPERALAEVPALD